MILRSNIRTVDGEGMGAQAGSCDDDILQIVAVSWWSVGSRFVQTLSSYIHIKPFLTTLDSR